jgi:hypothetical protein
MQEFGDRVTSAQAAKILGVDHSTMSRWSSGPDPRLTAVEQLPGPTGPKIFLLADVTALAAKRRKELEAKLARINGVAS